MYLDCCLDPCPASMRLGDPAPARVVTGLRPEIAGGTAHALPADIAALGGGRVVYMSLGTVSLFSQLVTFTVLLETVATEDLDVVVTIGPNNDPARLAALPANVHVHQWLPLRPLLDYCEVVVWHGGFGTTLAALSAGLPLVLAPQGADHFENALACEKAGAARVLRPRELESTAVRDAVLAVLPPESAEAGAAQRWAGAIAAMPTAIDAWRGHFSRYSRRARALRINSPVVCRERRNQGGVHVQA
jgi:UDP:flavonoid glycosyltransferase YjiC (YdhE family)